MEKETAKKFNLYKFLSNASIVTTFLAATVIVLFVTRALPFNAVLIDLVSAVIIACIGCLMALPWAKHLEKKELKVYATIFLCFIGVCVILWMIGVILAVNMVKVAIAEDVNIGEFTKTLYFIKYSVLITAQLITSNFIAINILRFKKRYLPWQIITYISFAFIDFYASYFIFCLSPSLETGIAVSPKAELLISKAMITMIALAIAYIAIALSVIRNLEMKRLGYVRRRGRFGRYYWEPAVPLQTEVEPEVKEEPKKEPAGAEEKLEKIKKLLDSGMITQEEYEEKRKKIIEEI